MKDLILTFMDNSLNSAQFLLDTINDLNTINKKKNLFYGTFTTEIIDDIDIFTMKEISTSLEIPLNLPNKSYPYPHIRIVFNWGTIIIFQKKNLN